MSKQPAGRGGAGKPPAKGQLAPPAGGGKGAKQAPPSKPRSRVAAALAKMGAVRLSLRWLSLVEKMENRPRTATAICERLDAKYTIPRPASSPHLPAYHAMVYLVGVIGSMAGVLALGLVAAFFAYGLHNLLIEVLGRRTGPMDQFWIWAGCLMATMIIVLVSLIEAAQLLVPFRISFQRSTYGTSQWAEPKYLKDIKLARPANLPLRQGELKVGEIQGGPLKEKHNIVLNPEQVLCHMAFFGPPGAGKSATYFCNSLHDWSQSGSVIVLDPKGELYDQTARFYENVFRIDLQNPGISDRWNFLPACKGDAEFAAEAASIILGVDATKHTNADPFWQEAESAALTALLLYLADTDPEATPGSVQSLISLKKFEELNGMMMAHPNKDVATYWGMFTKIKPETQGGVLIGLGVRMAVFNNPAAQKLAMPISKKDELRGVMRIDLAALRTAGTAIYVVVPEGSASRYRTVLATLFGMASSMLRKHELQPEDAPVLFIFDEAGNIPIHGLAEMLGVGRGRQVGVMLGYQNIGQVYAQYGNDKGDAILDSIGTMIFLPGLGHRTAEYASKRVGQVTTWGHTSIDVAGSRLLDSERSTEVGRPLLDASEVRRLVRHRQALAIIGNAPPIRMGYPPMAKLDNPPKPKRLVLPPPKGERPEAAEMPTSVMVPALKVEAKAEAKAGAKAKRGIEEVQPEPGVAIVPFGVKWTSYDGGIALSTGYAALPLSARPVEAGEEPVEDGAAASTAAEVGGEVGQEEEGGSPAPVMGETPDHQVETRKAATAASSGGRGRAGGNGIPPGGSNGGGWGKKVNALEAGQGESESGPGYAKKLLRGEEDEFDYTPKHEPFRGLDCMSR